MPVCFFFSSRRRHTRWTGARSSDVCSSDLASTEEMASTSQDLSRRAGEQAQLVRAAADDAARILQIAARIAQGADEAARRNADLSALARRHRDGLEPSTMRLAKLADECAIGAEEAEALAQASAKIQTFV